MCEGNLTMDNFLFIRIRLFFYGFANSDRIIGIGDDLAGKATAAVGNIRPERPCFPPPSVSGVVAKADENRQCAAQNCR
jgi:hypothetical protein